MIDRLGRQSEHKEGLGCGDGEADEAGNVQNRTVMMWIKSDGARDIHTGQKVEAGELMR